MRRGAVGAVRYIEDMLDDTGMGSPRHAGAFRTAVLQVENIMRCLTDHDSGATT